MAWVYGLHPAAFLALKLGLGTALISALWWFVADTKLTRWTVRFVTVAYGLLAAYHLSFALVVWLG